MESKRRFFSPFENGEIYIPVDIVEEFRWDPINCYWKISCSNGKSYGSSRFLDKLEQDMGISIKYSEKDEEDMKDDDDHDPNGIVW